MGKICDPPLFRGGQMLGIEYGRTCIQTVVSSPFGGNGTSRFLRRADLNLDSGVITRIEFGIFNNMSTFRIYGGGGIRVFDTGGGDYDATRFGGTFYAYSDIRFTPTNVNVIDTGGDPPPTNCRCTPDSCRVDCASAPDGFCCIDNSFTDRLLQIIKN